MAMTRKEVRDSIALAKEFITAGEALLDRIEWERGSKPPQDTDRSWSSPQSGTLRRKSMDLTRKLASLRKSGWES